MQDIRPYELIQMVAGAKPPSRPAPAVDEDAFETFLGAELGERSRPRPQRQDGPDMDYLAAELACRQWLAHTPAEDGATAYPQQTAYFLRNQRRPESSPMRALRLGGMLKAATLQLRSGVPATGIR